MIAMLACHRFADWSQSRDGRVAKGGGGTYALETVDANGLTLSFKRTGDGPSVSGTKQKKATTAKAAATLG